MRPRTALILLLAGLVGGGALMSRHLRRRHAVTQLDSFSPQKGLRAYIWRMVADPQGKRWVATGLFYGNGGPPHWYVRGSQDGGKTWATWNDTSEPADPGSEALGAAFTPDGAIYVNGTGGHDQTEVLRKSVDQGHTWKVLHVNQALFGGPVSLGDNLFTNSAGQLFELGSSVDVAGNQHWWVRKQQRAGANPGASPGSDNSDWDLLNDFQGGEADTNGNGDPQGMIETADHTLFVTGWWSSPVNNFSLLTTQLSHDGGRSWYLSDTFSLHAGEDSRGRGIFVGPRNRIFVAGHSSQGGVSRCLVRRSLDGGQNWTTVDLFLPDGAKSCAYLQGVAAGGEIYVAGHASARDGLEHRILRTSRDGGATWKTVFDDAGAYGRGAAYTYINADADGQIIVSGSVDHPTEGQLWTVERVSR